MVARAHPAWPTVLVVDDEEALRHLMARVLTDDGYRVLEAADGLEALTLFEKADPGIHLVVTDVLMPGMTGPELAGRLAKQSSPPPVLFVSGGANIPDLPGPLLRKPFKSRDLSALARDLLQQCGLSYAEKNLTTLD